MYRAKGRFVVDIDFNAESAEEDALAAYSDIQETLTDAVGALDFGPNITANVQHDRPEFELEYLETDDDPDEVP